MFIIRPSKNVAIFCSFSVFRRSIETFLFFALDFLFVLIFVKCCCCRSPAAVITCKLCCFFLDVVLVAKVRFIFLLKKAVTRVKSVLFCLRLMRLIFRLLFSFLLWYFIMNRCCLRSSVSVIANRLRSLFATVVVVTEVPFFLLTMIAATMDKRWYFFIVAVTPFGIFWFSFILVHAISRSGCSFA